MLYFMYHGVILIDLSLNFFCVYGGDFLNFKTPSLPEQGVCMFIGGCSSKISGPNSFPFPSRSKESYKCMDIRYEILSAKILSVPLLC